MDERREEEAVEKVELVVTLSGGMKSAHSSKSTVCWDHEGKDSAHRTLGTECQGLEGAGW